MKINYCGFTTVEQLIVDHKAIKERIKTWEKSLDRVINDEDCPRYLSEILEYASDEMMSVNME